MNFANYGPCVSLFAPGEDILSASHRSDSAYAIKSGSSMAAAVVAGAAALYLELFPDATPCDVKTALIESSTKNTLTFRKRGLETETPNRLIFVGALDSD
jgi:subtilisin family serine protease